MSMFLTQRIFHQYAVYIAALEWKKNLHSLTRKDNKTFFKTQNKSHFHEKQFLELTKNTFNFGLFLSHVL